MPKYPSKISPKIPKIFYQAFLELLGILDHFWDNSQLMIFPSSISYWFGHQ